MADIEAELEQLGICGELTDLLNDLMDPLDVWPEKDPVTAVRTLRDLVTVPCQHAAPAWMMMPHEAMLCYDGSLAEQHVAICDREYVLTARIYPDQVAMMGTPETRVHILDVATGLDVTATYPHAKMYDGLNFRVTFLEPCNNWRQFLVLGVSARYKQPDGAMVTRWIGFTAHFCVIKRTWVELMQSKLTRSDSKEVEDALAGKRKATLDAMIEEAKKVEAEQAVRVNLEKRPKRA